MASRFAVNITGSVNWDGSNTAIWSATSGGASGASVPTSSDDVTFDNASGTGTATIVTTGASAKSLTTAGGTGFLGTIAGSQSLTVAGSVNIGSGTTWSHTGSLSITATASLTTNGKSIGSSIAVTAGTTTLQGSLTTTKLLQTQAASFNANNFDVTALAFVAATSGTITLGSGTWTMTGNSAGSAWTASGVTVVCGTSLIRLTGGGASTKDFNGGDKTYYNFQNSTSGAGLCTIREANTFNDFTVDPGVTQSLQNGKTQTVGGTVSLAGTAIAPIVISSLTPGSAATLSKASGSVDASFCTIIDSTAAGGAVFSARTSSGNVDGGGNTGWLFDARVQQAAILRSHAP